MNLWVVFMQEFADALREFTNDKAGAENAEQTAGELEDMKRRLEQERKQHESKMQKDQQGKNAFTIDDTKSSMFVYYCFVDIN